MRNILVLFFTVSFLTASAQFKKVEYDKKIYVFKTYEDYKSDNGEYIGDYEGFAASNVFNKFWFTIKKENGKTKYAKLKKSYWGFKIGNFLFRRQTIGGSLVLCAFKDKEKIFYVSGSVVLRMLSNGGTSGWTSDANTIFYSDDYESKVFKIKNILKEEDDSLSELKKCIESSEEMEANYKDCIDDF